VAQPCALALEGLPISHQVLTRQPDVRWLSVTITAYVVSPAILPEARRNPMMSLRSC
jgi:hypothetical protein